MSNHPPRATRSSNGMLTQLLLAMVLLLATALVASELAAGMFRPWNDIRLAPSAGLLGGYPLYLDPTATGPIWSWIYGPVAPLFYLPAVLLPTPATAVGAGLIMTAAVFLYAGRALLTRSSTTRGVGFDRTSSIQQLPRTGAVLCHRTQSPTMRWRTLVVG